MRSLIVDLDDNLFPFVSKLLPLYNEKYSDNVQKEDITSYKIKQFLKPECGNIFNDFVDNDFILGLEPYPYAVEVLHRLNEKYSIMFATSGHPYTLGARHDLLSKYFTFYTHHNLVRTTHKALMQDHIMIDDCITNHIGFSGYSMLMTQPWNEQFNSGFDVRIKNWYDVEDYLL